MKRIVSSLLVFVSILVLLTNQVSALSPYPSGQVGVDVSWPNCSATIPNGAPFGIVGVSAGRAYDAGNPCLKAEASHFTNLSLYANTGLNIDTTSSTTNYEKAYQKANCATALDPAICGAYYYGYYAGAQIANQSVAAGVSSSNWWLDLEMSNTWNSDVSLNDQSLQGEYDGLHSVLPSITIGAYSTNYQWGLLAGSTFKPGWNVWYATAERRASQVPQYCATVYSFTGGTIELVQFKGKIDQDYAC